MSFDEEDIDPHGECAHEICRLRAEIDRLRSGDHHIAELVRENVRLREVVHAPLSPSEQRLIDKHCDWIAFGHAWNAVMKARRESLAPQQSAEKL